MAPLRLAGVLGQNDRGKARREMARVLFGRYQWRYHCSPSFTISLDLHVYGPRALQCLRNATPLCTDHRRRLCHHQDQASPSLLVTFRFPRQTPLRFVTHSEATPSRRDMLRARLFFPSEERQPSRSLCGVALSSSGVNLNASERMTCKNEA